MSGNERGSKSSKQQPGDQTGPQAAKAKQGSSILETVRQKMAYTIRGI